MQNNSLRKQNGLRNFVARETCSKATGRQRTKQTQIDREKAKGTDRRKTDGDTEREDDSRQKKRIKKKGKEVTFKKIVDRDKKIKRKEETLS